jgi:hypothetical protein
MFIIVEHFLILIFLTIKKETIFYIFYVNSFFSEKLQNRFFFKEAKNKKQNLSNFYLFILTTKKYLKFFL